MNKTVLIVGLEPSLIDFSDPAYAMVPGLDAAKVRAGLTADQNRLRALGYDAHLCLTDFGETAEPVLLDHLGQREWDCVLVGAGVRLNPANTPLFETIMNLIHRHASGAKLCFNTRPDDTAAAVARQMGDRS